MSVIQYTWKAADGFTPGRIYPVDCIILHSSDGHLQGDLDTLTGDHVSSHWLVGPDGSFYHLVDDANTAWHAGIVDDPQHHGNAATIGIEQTHIDGQEPWPDTQVNATAALVAALYQKHGISKWRSHAAVATFTEGGTNYGRKVDPQDFPADFDARIATAMQLEWTFEQIASQ